MWSWRSSLIVIPLHPGLHSRKHPRKTSDPSNLLECVLTRCPFQLQHMSLIDFPHIFQTMLRTFPANHQSTVYHRGHPSPSTTRYIKHTSFSTCLLMSHPQGTYPAVHPPRPSMLTSTELASISSSHLNDPPQLLIPNPLAHLLSRWKTRQDVL
jgi:hypothetical protein